MTEKFNKVSGFFKIETIKDSKVIDTFEQKNLIMDEARSTFAKYLAGINGTPVIDRFVLGTKGHIGADNIDGGDILAPKTEAQGFTSDRDMLFSEDGGIFKKDFEDIKFTVGGVSGDEVTVYSDNLITKSTVKCTVSKTDVIYEILINNDDCNGAGIMIFTECAFYTGEDIFSMKTFKGKIKDSTVSLRITWKIMF